MNKRIAFPFLTLSDSALYVTPWSLSLNGGGCLPASDYLENWDSASTIRLFRTLRVDPEVSALDLAIDAEKLALSVNVQLGSGQGRLSQLVLQQYHYVLSAEDGWKAVFEIELEGYQLSTILDIFTEITLLAPLSSSNMLSPANKGDRLWSDRVRTRLEGEEPRLPIETVELSELVNDPAIALAPWYLHWSPRDWNRDLHGAIRLYLNSSRSDFIERVGAEDPCVLQAMMADVMMQVCERLIMDPEADELFNNPEPGSLAAQAGSWLHKAWPGKDVTFIRSVLESRPGIFHSAILSLAELGET